MSGTRDLPQMAGLSGMFLEAERMTPFPERHKWLSENGNQAQISLKSWFNGCCGWSKANVPESRMSGRQAVRFRIIEGFGGYGNRDLGWKVRESLTGSPLWDGHKQEGKERTGGPVWFGPPLPVCFKQPKRARPG